MASGTDWSCPICRDVASDIAYVSTCLHQFCQSCILRWVRKNPSCPLCRQVVHTLICPAPHPEGLMEVAVLQQPAAPYGGQRAERRAAGSLPRAHVAGLMPETWATFFRNHAEILRPLELWLNEVLCGACWWDVAFAQGRIVASLCRYGLHEEALAQELQPFLQEQTATFVRQLIEVAADQCSELALQRVDGPGARAADGQLDAIAGSRGAAAFLEGAASARGGQEAPREEAAQGGCGSGGLRRSPGQAAGGSQERRSRQD